MEVLVKDTDFCNVGVEPGKGYIIRIKGYYGATFTVNEHGNLVIGQSAKMEYTPQVWNALQKEILEGQHYMAKVLMAGRYPIAPQPVYIKPKDLISGCIYRKSNGSLIWWLDRGRIIEPWSNREGCPYLYCTMDGVDEIQSITVDRGICFINTSPDSYIRLDSRSTRLSKLTELVWRPAASFHSIIHNNNKIGSWF